ncbi:MAG: NAD(P)/FAD-dependent oxidoreductase [Anaerolineae bacterium]
MQLRGRRVLLVDRQPIGAGQTSACGTIGQVVRYWGLEHTMLQQHDTCYLHTPWHAIRFPSPYLWCTFDYQAFCQSLFERSGAEFLQARALGFDGRRVQTSRGDLEGRCLVDASGWRAVLATSLLGPLDRTRMNWGIESICEVPADAGLDRSALHFWYDHTVIRHGMGWAFPRGATVSIGLGSYGRTEALREPLQRMLAVRGAQGSTVHGGYYPCGLRALTAGPLFIVGDAAGMCLGLTGEGIRPALFFGEICGRVLRRVLEGSLSLQEGQAAYVAEVQAKRRLLDVFAALQEFTVRMPERVVDAISLLIAREPMRRWIYERYWNLTRAWSGPSPYVGARLAAVDREVERAMEASS